MALNLIGFKHILNTRVTKAAIAAKVAGLQMEITHATPSDDVVKSPAYALNCSPVKGLPTLQTEDGYLFESTAILRHIVRLDKTNQFLYGRTTYEASQCDQWIDFVATELDPTAFPFVYMAFGMAPKDESRIAELTETLNTVLGGLEAWLEIRTFIVGERLTIADIALVASLHMTFLAFTDVPSLFAKFKNVVRYYYTIMAQPKVADGFVACGGDGKAVEKPKAEAPKPAEKPKEAPKPAAPKPPADDEDDEDDEVKEEPKAKNPLDSLPPSKLVLDAFKREYSNKDTRTEAAPWFFANYDDEGYTCFWAHYKYNADAKMQFMTANLVRGWFQRMEHTRKYAFGVALIMGEDKVHDLSALWVFRGKGVPQIVLDVEDTELFDWVEIKDVQAEAAKITDYFAWEGPTIAKPVLEGRCFK